MLTSVAAAQPLFLAVILGWAGVHKLSPLFARRARSNVDGSALARLLGPRRAALAFRAVGVVELIAAASFLAPPAFFWEPWLGVVLAAGFLSYLGFARVKAPKS